MIKIKSLKTITTMKKARTKTKRGIQIFACALAIAVLNAGCQSPSLKANKTAPNSATAGNNLSSLEQDLQTMRNANFEFIFVFRRKDGGALDGEDKKYLKANSPVFTNRFILTDENKAAVAGSSYKFEPENLEKLQQRFVIENFSNPENAPKNSNNQENSNR
jgi:outer membrane murein-binding lipoprotein Lpp